MAQPDLIPEERAALQEVMERKKISEDFNAPYRRRCDELYSHYRGFKGLQGNLGKASPPDRDTLLRDAQSEWGSDLVIPFAFSTVETILPRAVSNRPKMQLLPVDEDAESSVENMRYLIDQQQQKNNYEMKLEETAKSGFIYGLGVQKLFWKTTYVSRPSLTQQLMFDPQTQQTKPMWIEGPESLDRDWDDWAVEDIDLADFFWDPYGFDMESVQWVIHRTWRDHKYVLGKIERGEWSTDAVQQLEREDVTGMDSTNQWGSAFSTRNRAAGFTSNPQGDQRHEILEFHDGERVITVLDGQIPVVIGRNPARHRQIPFSVFRPSTAGIKQLAGIGVVEPIEQLLREISTLRSQRRDNAALVLAKIVAFSDGAIDVGDMQIFPGAAWPVHGEPKDMLYPIDFGGDIAGSSYNEEDRIVQDIERTTGISDSVTGADASQGAASTATGVQLVQSAANIRINRQTRRLEVELVTRECGQAVAWNQQKIVEAQQKMVMIPKPQQPGVDGPAWDRRMLSPPELWGRFVINIEGGSIAAKNMPQQIQLAQSMKADFGDDPHIDQRALTKRRLELYGFSQPEAYVVPDQPPLSPDVLERLEALGVEKEKIDAAVSASQRENPQEGRGEASEQEQQPEEQPA